ncbi:hypothetical protein [Mechercharimyces sp. CAU 1602]|uniref:hypothetical protein n=1 Tax=Mechercharimyces sp. CAU 1602 TaxID=2973933 RepID=UPI002161F117|nr:hypothetical protein [Mechercharimyces sp. CAU 1602]MCS1352818.1 hypothetical protein [Mechercharimyces sp. CAU 1602]
MDWLKVSEIVGQTGWGEKTVRRYIEDYPESILTRRFNGVLLVKEEAIVIMEQIRQLYKDGWEKDRIKKLLLETHPVNVLPTDDRQSPVLSRQDLIDMKNLAFQQAQMIKDLSDRQEELIHELKEIKREQTRSGREIQSYLSEQRDDNQEIKQTLSRVEIYSRKRRGLFSRFRRDD